MKKQLNRQINGTRDRVIFFLQFITSDRCIGECHKFISPENLSYKLAGVWFNQIYSPAKRFFEAVKNNYSEEEAIAFVDCFSKEEFSALERFHLCFDLRLDMLTQNDRVLQAIPNNDQWQNIRKDARYALKKLLSDPESKKLNFEEVILSSLKEHKDPHFTLDRLNLLMERIT